MNRLTIVIPERIQKQIRLLSQIAEGEISWIGDIKIVKNAIWINDIFLIEQNTLPDETFLVDDAYAKFIYKYVAEGKDVADLKLWLHSHGNFETCWSKKDEAVINTHARSDFFVSIVTNKYGDILARVDYFKPLRVTFSNISVVTDYEYSEELIEESKAAVSSLVHYHEPEPEIEPISVSKYRYPRKRNGVLV